MINSVRALALATYKENIRDRIMLALVVFCLLLLGSTVFLGSISLDQDSKIIIDFGLFGIFFFGVIITLFVSGSTIAKELDQRTAYTVLARPIKRSWFIAGKFSGIAMTLATLTASMALVFFVLLAIRLNIHDIDLSLILAIIYLYLELLVLAALLLLFSSFTSSVLSVIYGFAVLLIGHSTPTIVALIRDTESIFRYIFLAIYYIFPNFEKFNLRNDAVYHLTPNPLEVFLVFGYATAFIVLFLYLAGLTLQKTEL